MRVRTSVRTVRATLAAVLAAALFHAQVAQAQGIRLLRDAEIEALVGEYAAPVLRVAGLGASNIRIHLVKSRDFNAFVVDGNNMFLNAGAIMKAETPNMLIGVIAHEAGHIAGGHLARLRATVARAQTAAFMLQLLGMAAMAVGAATGGGDDLGEAGAAVMYGGQSAVQRSILAYQQVEEGSADQAAVTYLNQTKQSSEGMLRTFRLFAEQGRYTLANADPYLMSHPMPAARIAQLENLARSSPYFNNRDSEALQLRHDLVRAKLDGFMNDRSPDTTLRKYPASNTSLPARYARAIARYFAGGMRAAAGEIDALIAAQPENPYFHELKGQFLLESNQAQAAVAPLRKAANLAPNSPLIRTLFAQSLLATGTDSDLKEAVGHLQKALARENQNALGYRLIGQAYGRLNRIGDAALASAQYYFYSGDLKNAKQQATTARQLLPENSTGWIRADDILNFKPPKAS